MAEDIENMDENEEMTQEWIDEINTFLSGVDMTTPLEDNFTRRLNKAMTDSGMPPFEIARVAGIPMEELSPLIVGTETNPRINTVIAIAHAIDASLDFLLDGKDTSMNLEAKVEHEEDGSLTIRVSNKN